MDANKKFLNLVKNKRIAIVGPSPHLIGSEAGKVIDQYDLVCRVNDIIPAEDLRKDYGSKTDIMFHNLGTDWMNGLKDKIKNNKIHWNNLKMVVCPTIKAIGPQNDYLSWPDDYVSDVENNFNSINDCDIPFYWIGVKNYKELWHKFGTEPNCGMLAVMMLSIYPIKELLVTGFSFYSQGSSKKDLVYYRNHRSNKIKDSEDYGGGHLQEPQKKVFKTLLSTDERIKIDSYLQKLLYS